MLCGKIQISEKKVFVTPRLRTQLRPLIKRRKMKGIDSQRLFFRVMSTVNNILICKERITKYLFNNSLIFRIITSTTTKKTVVLLASIDSTIPCYILVDEQSSVHRENPI